MMKSHTARGCSTLVQVLQDEEPFTPRCVQGEEAASLIRFPHLLLSLVQLRYIDARSARVPWPRLPPASPVRTLLFCASAPRCVSLRNHLACITPSPASKYSRAAVPRLMLRVSPAGSPSLWHRPSRASPASIKPNNNQGEEEPSPNCRARLRFETRLPGCARAARFAKRGASCTTSSRRWNRRWQEYTIESAPPPSLRV